MTNRSEHRQFGIHFGRLFLVEELLEVVEARVMQEGEEHHFHYPRNPVENDCQSKTVALPEFQQVAQAE